MRLEKPVILVFWFFKFDNGKCTKFQSGIFLDDAGTVSQGDLAQDAQKIHRAFPAQ